MSKMPVSLGSNEPTTHVPPRPKQPAELPAEPRSHSASVGRRYSRPVVSDSHSEYACASFQLTHATGCSPVCEYPGSRQLRRRRPQRASAASGTAAAKARYSSSVTSYRPRATSPSGRGTISGQTSQSVKTPACTAGGVKSCRCAHCVKREAKARMQAQAMVRRACPSDLGAWNMLTSFEHQRRAPERIRLDTVAGLSDAIRSAPGGATISGQTSQEAVVRSRRAACRVCLAAADRHQHPVAGGRLGERRPAEGRSPRSAASQP